MVISQFIKLVASAVPICVTEGLEDSWRVVCLSLVHTGTKVEEAGLQYHQRITA